MPKLRFPLTITTVGEAIAVLDAVGSHVSYTYFEDEPIRRQSTKRVTKAEAVEIAQMIARALTESLAPPDAIKPGPP